jgi:hypothetical protein
MINWNEIFVYDETSKSCLRWKERGLLKSKHKDLSAGCFNKVSKYYSVKFNKKNYQVHRIIFEMFNGKIPNGKFLDHIDNNRSNNKIENLRLATHSENMKNRNIPKNNNSGYKGVYFRKDIKKWYVQITLNNKRINLGVFLDILEASAVYDKAAIKYFGEFALTNKILKIKEDIR